jgi:ketosteroid isomerase-like protein
MSAYENKQLMQDIFSELSKGNGKPFVDAMADDIHWTWMGTVNWSKTFMGKKSVINELLDPGTSLLTEPFFKYFAHRFIAEGDYVVVESRGLNMLRDGRPYNNKYCWVCHIVEGKLQELHEYMDTELVTATFHSQRRTE